MTPMRRAWPRKFTGLLLFALSFARCAAALSESPTVADSVYRNGKIYTVDAQDSVREAIAIAGGRIVYVGSDAGVAAYVGHGTSVTDLGGRMLMPGLVDGHMHPLQGGAALLKCNLHYAHLTVAEMQERIQGCIDQDAAQGRELGTNAWLEVVNWFQEAMVPAGVVTNHATLDALTTTRPILVMSSFGHTVLLNARALRLSGITAKTLDPAGGRIARDAAGVPTGILEDAAQDSATRLLPQPTPEDDVRSAAAALDAMRRQGITSFLDAMAVPPSMAAFRTLQARGKLSARAHFAVLITPAEGIHPHEAVMRAKALAVHYDQGPLHPDPQVTVRNVKLFLDGVISAPALTGAMREPYFVRDNAADARPDAGWVPGKSRGPEVYFPAATLRAMLAEIARAGLEPHLHVDGDRAVHEGLDGIESLRRRFPGRDIRAALAHDEIVDPADFPRYAALNVIPVLSFQWEKRAPDTVDNAEAYLGPRRYHYMEPAGFLAAAGARIAYGSDWPVDELDEWFALKVGVTRTNAPSAGPEYAGRLSADPGLSRAAVLRAITMNSSYELHQDRQTGSLEVGKFADLIVLDRDVLSIPAEDIAATRVLQTLVGGRIVYQSENFPQ
jgi:predicted amidohydrolase YtcJ